MEWIATILVEVAKLIGKDPENARKVIESVKGWFRGKGKPGILILGPGGTGKTTLSRILAAEDSTMHSQYDESYEVEKFPLRDDPKVSIVVPPGQEHRRDATWNDLLQELATGKYRGVILLSSYGYHSIGSLSYKETGAFDPKQPDKDTFLRRYTESKRADEIEILQRILPFVEQCRHPLWLFTIVTKEDIWWPERDEVRQHYMAGPYAALIKAATSKKDGKNFRYEHEFGCLTIGNFKTGVGEDLRHNAAGYDHAAQIQSLVRIVNKAGSLARWELKKP